MSEEGNQRDADGVEAPSELEQKIIEQVEYYFGDTNLRRDKFMKQCMAENDGWVSMDTMLKFRRLQILSDDKGVICAALRKSQTGLIEVADDDSKIRRDPSRPFEELTENTKKELDKRTAYAKGFPETATLDDIKDFLSRHGFSSEHVRGIIMRRRLDNRNFKGSVFVEFASVEQAQRFAAADTEMRFADDQEPILRLLRDDYFQKKTEERRQQKIQAKAEASSAAMSSDGQRKDHIYEKGCVLHFEGCGENTRRETLKELFGRFEDVAWVNFQMNDKSGQIRFANAGGAERALEKVKEEGDGKVMINDVEAACRVIEGDEEEQYWKQARESMAQMKPKYRAANSRPGRGKGRGNKRRGDWGGAPRSKKPKSS